MIKHHRSLFVIIEKDSAMKTYLPLSMYLIAGIMLLPACSDDVPAISPLPEKTYTGNANLKLEYNGAPMSGKSVTYTQSGNTANLVMNSTASLEELSAALKGLPPIPGPGVLPGTPVLTLPVNLYADGDKYEFEGSGETDYVTYRYTGDINADVLDFEFEDVMLKNQRLANTVWTPAPTEKETSGIGYKSLPLHIVWECSLPPILEGFDGTIQDALILMSTLPIIPAYNNTAYMSLVQAIGSALKTIAFRPDGNAVVTYLQTNNGAAQFAQAPICMIQYVPLSDTNLKLYINPTDLMGQILINTSSHPDLPANPFGKSTREMTHADTDNTATGGNTSTESTTPSIQNMMPIILKLAPMLSEGIPMQYDLTQASLQIYLNTETLLPLLQGVIVPLLEDPSIQASIIEKTSANPSLIGYLPLIKALVAAFPQLLATTTRLELGINLLPLKP